MFLTTRDARCLATALTAQRPPNKRPCEDALLKAERSQRRRIELLEEQLHAADLDVPDLARKLKDTERTAVIAEEAELALRWFEAGITWRARWGDDDEGSTRR